MRRPLQVRRNRLDGAVKHQSLRSHAAKCRSKAPGVHAEQKLPAYTLNMANCNPKHLLDSTKRVMLSAKIESVEKEIH